MMLQTFLERLIAAAGKGHALAKSLVQGGVQFADSALPVSRVQRKWVIVGFFSLPVLGAVVAIASSGENSLPDGAVGSTSTIVEAIDLNHGTMTVFNADPLVAEVLQLAQFVEHHCVPQMNIRCGGV